MSESNTFFKDILPVVLENETSVVIANCMGLYLLYLRPSDQQSQVTG